ncbi:metallophosphoesterase family protein [Spirosoma sp. KCTC 42546]|uniref:metallophosphoesterase family protein n=1 Tax=Spirosoma sp. KCTC 42546 TaxID=2520506 RepID=UPI001156DA73|nr:metallophosphoesterase family protein [Spirosoma sp. KCTC 42546]QDK81220.1 metallophosphoesterase family protein [Spirosoma sp. KCTC 42546]
MKLAFIADIHANVWALQAVLEDIEKHGIALIYDLGDTLYGPLDPVATYRLLQEKHVQSISGNQDRFILENKTSNPTFDYVIKELWSTSALEWLESLPSTRVIEDDIILCHGTPDNDSEYLIEDIKPGHVTVKESSDLVEKLRYHPQRLVLCGHSHLPRIVKAGQKVIVNPGSVGLQAYEDDSPIYHKMESGSPFARYCIVTFEGDLKTIDLIAVDYNVEAAARCAEKNNRDDWANRLRNGFV